MTFKLDIKLKVEDKDDLVNKKYFIYLNIYSKCLISKKKKKKQCSLQTSKMVNISKFE